jgi:putative MATE family efflux protein
VSTLRKKLIGDRAFYSMVLAVALPMMLQDGITTFVNLLDNVMVGRTGTEQMSGVAIINQLMLVYNLCIFGGLSGAGIFAAQFFGHGDMEGVRNAFRFKLYIGAIATAVGAAVFLLFGQKLVFLFLQGNDDVGDINATAAYGMQYLKIMLIGTVPFFLTQTYASTLKETGQTVLPMKASTAAVLTNLVLNYILIYGKLGLPALGVRGAAIATVIARVVELFIIVVTVHTHQDSYLFVKGLFKTLKVPVRLAATIMRKGLPLLINEFAWSSGMAILSQCYSLRGLSVIAAINISSTVSNLFSVVLMSLGGSVAIIIGHQLGAGDMAKAKETDIKLIAFAVGMSVVVGIVLAAAAPYIPKIYNTEETVRKLATEFMLISAAIMPVNAFSIAAYFTLRSGGKTIVTFLFDSGFTWLFSVPTAYMLAHYTNLDITVLYLFVQLTGFLKCALGFIFVSKGIWLHNIIIENNTDADKISAG